jgi:ribosomal protein S18 acetylase RimI-like enzyme
VNANEPMAARCETFKPGDVREVVRIHLDAFPGFFLSQLGPGFLRTYYAALARDPSAVALTVLDDTSRVVGFAVGAVGPRGFYSRLLRRSWWRFAIAAIPAVIRSPSRLTRVLRATSHPGENPAGDHVCGLFSIAVDPSASKRGLGGHLLQQFVSAAQARGCRDIVLTTDGRGNDAVNRFYVAAGFQLERSFQTPEGRVMNEYRKRTG